MTTNSKTFVIYLNKDKLSTKACRGKCELFILMTCLWKFEDCVAPDATFTQVYNVDNKLISMKMPASTYPFQNSTIICYNKKYPHSQIKSTY